MSEQLPIKIAPGPQPASSKASTGAVSNDVSAENQSEFGNVLSNQVQQNDAASAHSASDNDVTGNNVSPEGLASALPQDGNALPVSTELPEAVVSETLTELTPLDEITLDTELAPESDDIAALVAPVGVVDSKPAGVINLNGTGNKSAPLVSKTDNIATIPPSVIADTVAGEADNDTAQAEAITQLRRFDTLEGKVISLVSRGDIEKTPFQANKILEQFADVGAKQPASAINVSSPVSTLSPVNASSSVTTSATGLQQVSIDVPVQDQQWQRAFAERVVWSVGNNQSVQVRINPAELGPIDIQLNVSKEQTNITFNTVHATTRDSIESALPRLREMLANEGLNLGDVDVRHQDSSAQGQAESQEQGNGTGQKAFGNQESESEAESGLLLHPVMVSERAVDYYI